MTPEHPASGVESPVRRSAARDLTLAAVALASGTVAIAASWAGAPGPSFGFWLAACFAGELLWVRLPFGRATLSMASTCNFAALILLPRAEAMLAAAGASLVAELLVMRKPPARLLFNAGQTALAVGAAGLVYHTLAGATASPAAVLLAKGLWPILAAAAAYAAVNTGSVSLAIGVAERVAPWRAWWSNFGSLYELLSTSSLFSLGVLLAVLHALVGPAGTLLVCLPLLLSHESYRRYLGRRADAGAEARRAA